MLAAMKARSPDAGWTEKHTASSVTSWFARRRKALKSQQCNAVARESVSEPAEAHAASAAESEEPAAGAEGAGRWRRRIPIECVQRPLRYAPLEALSPTTFSRWISAP
jgi:hypothetical protein